MEQRDSEFLADMLNTMSVTWDIPILAPAADELRRLSAIEAERDALRAEVERLQAAPAPVAQADTITVREAWEAAGGNPGIKATKAELLDALSMLDKVCDEAPAPVAQPEPMACGHECDCRTYCKRDQSPSLASAQEGTA